MTRRRRSRLRTARAEASVDALVTEVYERHAGSIAAYALRRAAACDAADVVADTFLVAWRRHDDMPDEPQTLPWLYGVARRVLANQRRSRDRRTRLHERLQHGFVEFENSADRVEQDAEFSRVAAALSSLADDDAELLRLTAWEGLSPSEIATVMELESGVVRQRLRRARQRLRVVLDRENCDEQHAVWRPSDHRGNARFEPHWSAEGSAS